MFDEYSDKAVSPQKEEGGESDGEEGEVLVYDQEAYIVSDGEIFRFERSKDVKVNWRAVRQFDTVFEEQANMLYSLQEEGIPLN